LKAHKVKRRGSPLVDRAAAMDGIANHIVNGRHRNTGQIDMTHDPFSQERKSEEQMANTRKRLCGVRVHAE
jgi:hypothetical protein